MTQMHSADDLEQGDDEVGPGVGPYNWDEAFRQNPDQPQPGDTDFDVPPEMMRDQ